MDMVRSVFVLPPPDGRGRTNFPYDIVTGKANPMGMAADITRDGDVAVLRIALGPAFEGAPGRAHGGAVAALVDEVMGFVLSIHATPAYTGRLTVTYRAPTPLGVELEIRARLRSATVASSRSRPMPATAPPSWPRPKACSSPSTPSASRPDPARRRENGQAVATAARGQEGSASTERSPARSPSMIRR